MIRGLVVILFLLTTQAMAKPLVLLSYYDAFEGAKFNNSGIVAKLLAQNPGLQSVDLRLCALETKFATAYPQLETCFKELERAPDLVLSLGETGCDLKLELAMNNWDQTIRPDNAGEQRKAPIIAEAPKSIGLTYPLPDMYCSLPAAERKQMRVSTNAGSFVCNNAAFQMTYFYPEVVFGFIHVPSNFCRNLAEKNTLVVRQLTQMISSAVSVPRQADRLPISKEALKLHKNDEACRQEFFGRVKPIRK